MKIYWKRGAEEMTRENGLNNIEALRKAIADSDTILVGAGAGLSTSAGFQYSGSFFTKYFGDFQKRFGIQDIYSGGFYPFPNMETFWAWWSRHIYLNRYASIPKPEVYTKLLSLVEDKDYFVLTTNVDHCFQRTGFDKERLFYTQGDYGLLQSSRPSGHSAHLTYDNEDIVRSMLLSQGFMFAEDGELLLPENGSPLMEVPSEMVPRCPDDGELMTTNLRADNSFVEDAGWHKAAARYGNFLANHGINAQGFFTSDSTERLNRNYNGKILFLELGVGANTPGIIKYPFWKMTYENPNATYACLNFGEAMAPKEIKDRSICINGDLKEILAEL